MWIYLLLVAALHSVDVDALTNHQDVLRVGRIDDKYFVGERNKAFSKLRCNQVDNRRVENKDTRCVAS